MLLVASIEETSIVPTLPLLGGFSRFVHPTFPPVSFPLVPRLNVPYAALTRPLIKLHQRELQGNLVGVEVGSFMPT